MITKYDAFNLIWTTLSKETSVFMSSSNLKIKKIQIKNHIIILFSENRLEYSYERHFKKN